VFTDFFEYCLTREATRRAVVAENMRRPTADDCRK
jgi:hypothetical protein